MAYAPPRRFIAIAIVTLFLSRALLSLAQQQQHSQNVTASETQTIGNVSATHSANATSVAQNNTSSNTTAVSTQTSASPTPTTFPIASIPSTGALQGTAQAPFPANGKSGHSNALGPDDNYIAAATAILPSAVMAASTFLILLTGIWLL